MNKKKQKNSKSALTRIWQRALGILLAIGIPAIIFASTFSIKNVTVVGSTRYTTEEISEKILKTKLDSNALILYLKYKYFMDAKIPFVEKVDIELAGNHSVNIYVYEKKVTGCVDFLGEYMYFDKDGIVVESSSKRLEDIPQIKGLQFNEIILNEKLVLYDKIILDEKLEVQKEELFKVILNLTLLIDKYELKVNTISFNSKYEVTIDCGDSTVLLGRKSTYDEVLAELKNILAESKGMKLSIDMRNYVKGTNQIIAKPENPTE